MKIRIDYMDKILKIIVISGCILAVLVLVFLNLPKNALEIGKVCVRDHCFEVEVAKTPLQREKGLMFREHLNNDKGMLFVFEQEGDYPFWMKNTLIPLDMIWINQNQEIVFIKENAQPCEQVDCPIIEPGQNAKYVLEINGGVVKDINLTLGDKILF